MRLMRIITDSGNIEVSIADHQTTEWVLRDIMQRQSYTTINPDGTGAFVPYHAIKMIMIVQKENHEGTGTKQ